MHSNSFGTQISSSSRLRIKLADGNEEYLEDQKNEALNESIATVVTEGLNETIATALTDDDGVLLDTSSEGKVNFYAFV